MNDTSVPCTFTMKLLADTLAQEIQRSRGAKWETENWFYWPPDIFALTSIFLKETGIYRYMVTPHPSGERLRCGQGKKEAKQFQRSRADWYRWLREKNEDFPEFLRDYVALLNEEATGFDGKEYPYEYCARVLRLHALADAVCEGLGILSVYPYGPISVVYFLANYLLAAKGTLSRLPKHCGIVLPKTRTPQRGLTLRSFSHNLTFHESEVAVRWRTVPWSDNNERTLNILAVPMPYEIKSPSFKKRGDYPVKGRDVKNIKYFEYHPNGEEAGFDIDLVLKLLKEAQKEVDRVHLVVFPEAFLTDEQASSLRQALATIEPPQQIPMIITGIREKKIREERKKVNEVELSVFFAKKWYKLGQGKHHRWRLDRRQIQQYSLGGSLNVQYDWWEAIDLNRRELTFLAPNGWLTLCPLICEDLAQLEPVSDLIRGVGPTLVVAILMDGPQLNHRWPARYVSVLADDPGTSVLTLTSLGMAIRSRAKGQPVNRTVALWKDQKSDFEPIEMKEGDQAVLLTIHADQTEEFTADGRSDNKNSSLLVLQSIHFLRIKEAGKATLTEPLLKDEQRISRFDHPVQEEDVRLQTALEPDKADVKVEVKESKGASDVLELTAFSYLAAAIIDAPGVLIREFRNRVKHSNDETRLIEATKPFDDIWDQIKDALRAEARWHEGDPDYVSPKPKGHFDEAVETLCDFMGQQNSELEFPRIGEEQAHSTELRPNNKSAWKKQKKERDLKRIEERLTRWESIVSRARRELDAIENLPLVDDEARRLKRIPYVSVIWAVHNRLLIHRQHRKWKKQKSYRDLRSSIEKWVSTTSLY